MNEMIIDGNSLFARCWFAVRGDVPEALRVAVNLVLALMDRERGNIEMPIHRTLFAWDGRPKTDKNRDPKPREYGTTMYRFQEALLTLFNTVHGFHEDFEADDIVATAAYSSTAEQVYVVSGDKDLMQLQGGNVAYYCLNAKGLLSPRAICHKFGVKQPNQAAIALAILGDRGDNISGIPRWGPKKVQKIFEAVTDKMNFCEALRVVQDQIPEGELLDLFMASLDKTLLHMDVPGVPEPTDLVFCSSQEVIQAGIHGVSQSYERVAQQYEDGSAVDEMLKDSSAEPGRQSRGRRSGLP